MNDCVTAYINITNGVEVYGIPNIPAV